MVGFNTELVFGKGLNQLHDNNTGAVNVPIYQSSTYAFDDIDADNKYDYSRSLNPTREYLEKQIAVLEKAKHGYAFASGSAAIHAVFTLFVPGDHIVVSKNIYGGTFRLINDYLKHLQIEFTQVDTQNLEEVEAAIQPNTKAIYFEPIDNPFMKVTSIRAVSAIAKKHGVLTIVDNTFLTPYLQRPLALGADVVIHSATKYLGGHSDVIAGLVVTNHDDIGEKLYFSQNAVGGILSPENCILVIRGIKTLSVRLDRHIQNAQTVLKYLDQKEDFIKKIYYPGRAGDASDQVAQEELKGYGGVISFELKDNVDPKKLVNSTQLIWLAVSLGSVESLIELPYYMTHAELPLAERQKVGIGPNLVRLSVGLEDPEDLIADLEQAVATATK
ncbi:trans-sulfuration enzyme family protein [Convivina intestini]|uniref:Cystathionine beta-lyase n=1 Tax=Convivina intestini TaxID=1505726 RepID=A0A2U1D9W8_9LACO|nr:PLP-dependent aspartate aminotransferase family protein [Convivina intestini]PVY84342.1 cystathionine beta-lyase [Convivina intestini]CAH1857031.1 Cystathionine beta-lyase [Convivina intestini]SDC06442.1 cystathionine beta-lyase [Leuconostocaceae bacterium R-53105]